MALWVTARNISGLAPVSEYEVEWGINKARIGNFILTGHKREEGAGVLVKRIGEMMIERANEIHQ